MINDFIGNLALTINISHSFNTIVINIYELHTPLESRVFLLILSVYLYEHLSVFVTLRFLSSFVLRERLELSRLSTVDPKSTVTTNSTTRVN